MAGGSRRRATPKRIAPSASRTDGGQGGAGNWQAGEKGEDETTTIRRTAAQTDRGAVLDDAGDVHLADAGGLAAESEIDRAGNWPAVEQGSVEYGNLEDDAQAQESPRNSISATVANQDVSPNDGLRFEDRAKTGAVEASQGTAATGSEVDPAFEAGPVRSERAVLRGGSDSGAGLGGKPYLRVVGGMSAKPSPQVAATSGKTASKGLTALPQVAGEVAETEWRVEWRTTSTGQRPLMARLWVRVGGKWQKARRQDVANGLIQPDKPLVWAVRKFTAEEAKRLERFGDENIKRLTKYALNTTTRRRRA